MGLFNRNNRDNNRDNYNDYERDNFGRQDNNFDNTIDARDYARQESEQYTGSYQGNFNPQPQPPRYNGYQPQSRENNDPARAYDYDDSARRGYVPQGNTPYRQPNYMNGDYRQNEQSYQPQYTPPPQRYIQPEGAPQYVPPQQKYPREQQESAPQQVQRPVNDVMVRAPQNYNDIKNIINYLRNKQAVIVQVKDISPELAQRFLDFLTGAIYALNGSSEEVSRNFFLFTPAGVSINVTLDFKNKGKDR